MISILTVILVIILIISAVPIVYLFLYEKLVPKNYTSEPADIYMSGTTKCGVQINEEPLRDKILFWPDECLDTSYYGLTGLHFLDKLSSPESNYLKAFTDNKDRKPKIRNFILEHYIENDNNTRGFKQTKDTKISLYATFCGMAIISMLEKCFFKGTMDHDPKIFKDYLNNEELIKIKHYIKRCGHSLDGSGFGFSEVPYKKPTIHNTYAADYLYFCIEGKNYEENISIEQIIKFTFACYREEAYKKHEIDEIYGGFVISPNIKNGILSCITFYALQILKKYQCLNDENRDKIEKIRRFLLLCKQNDDGFSLNPNNNTSNILYTDLAIRSLKKIVSSSCPSDLKKDDRLRRAYIAEEMQKYIDFDKTADYVIKRMNKNGGFSFGREDAPNLYMTRRAISILYSLKKFGYDIQGKIGDTIIHKIRNFIYSCYNDNTGGFVGYYLKNPKTFPN